MANQIEGVTERLLTCATREFLKKGYSEASLRAIAEAAQTSTSSIYVRFGDKSGLFSAIVNEACEDFYHLCETEISRFNQTNAGMSFDAMIAFKMGMVDLILDSIYSHYDAFKLLASRAESAAFNQFIHSIADLESAQTQRYIDEIHSDVLCSGRLFPELLHTLASAYWAGVFEIVVRDMSREDARTYFLQLKRFFQCGWMDLLAPQEPGIVTE